MVNILATADLHLTNTSSKFPFDKFGVSEFLKRQKDYISHLCELIEQNNYDWFLFLGDWTDKETLDPVLGHYSNYCLNQLILTCQSNRTKMIFLEGNHCISDVHNHHTVFSSAEAAFQGLVDDEILNFVYKQDVVTDHENGVEFSCFPYQNDLTQLHEDIDTRSQNCDENYFQIMLFHFPCCNAMLDNKMAAKKGVNLSSEITKGFDICLGGDYHTFQRLEGNPSAFYVGAPFDMKFGEAQRRATVEIEVDSEGLTDYTDQDGGGEGWRLRRVDNPHNVPMVTVDAESDDIAQMDLTDKVVRVINYTDDVDLDGIDCLAMSKRWASKDSFEQEDEDATIVENNSVDSLRKKLMEKAASMDDFEETLEAVLKQAGY